VPRLSPSRRGGTLSPPDVRTSSPWAKAIKAAVIQRKMPPWFADPHYGKFANDSSLPEALT
jgi:hypothetical protein